MSPRSLLLCTDLDRTLIPNGEAPESAGARERLARLVAELPATLVYATGRHQALVEEAIEEWGLPHPDYVLGDVGTSIYRVQGTDWTPVAEWWERIGRDWAGFDRSALAERLSGVEGIEPQESEKQGQYKQSYYAAANLDSGALIESLRRRLEPLGLRISAVWSLDDLTGVGLLDILPASASKYRALAFLMGLLGQDEAATVFAGDSGNDLEVLESPIPSVLVANASAEVRAQAVSRARALGNADRLYLAAGAIPGMNGNYAAGILEGVRHFRPDLIPTV